MQTAQDRPVLDLTDELCPLTFVKTKLALEGLAQGELLEVKLQGLEAIRNVPQSLKAEGHKILEARRDGDGWRLVIERR